MMRNWRLYFILIAACAIFTFASSPAYAGQPVIIVVNGVANIPVANWSFENPALELSNFTSKFCSKGDPICVQTNTPVDGWIVSGTAGTWRPTAAAYPGGAPEGENVAYGNSGSESMISQVLTAVLEPTTSYLLSADVGRRADDGFAGYKVQLWAGAFLLAEDDDGLSPAPGTFVRSTISANTGPVHPALGENLKIVLVSKGRQTNFDDIVLTSHRFAPSVKVPFYAKLLGGDEKLIVKNGSLELYARCLANLGSTVELYFTSTEDGWFSNGSSMLAGTESQVAWLESELPLYNNNADGRTAAAPDGSFIGVDRESTGVGVNVFGYDCVAIGAALLVNDIPPPF